MTALSESYTSGKHIGPIPTYIDCSFHPLCHIKCDDVPILYICKEDCLSLSVYLNAFAQFSRYRAETSQVG